MEKHEENHIGESQKHEGTSTVPPDGGTRAWLVMIASFLCNGILFGVINTYSVIYVDLQKKLEDKGITEASSKASLVGSLAIGSTFFFSPLAGIITDRIGIRWTTFVGGAMASGGMLLSSFSNSVEFLYLTYGVLFGVGASLAYTPSLVILGHYFKRYLGVVNGFVTAGSSVFTIVMPYALAFLLKTVGLEATMLFMSALIAVIMACALLFKPLPGANIPPSPSRTSRLYKHGVWSCVRNVINVDIWKKKKYVIWALAVPSALFGYFVPYVHMLKLVEDNFKDGDGKILVMCLGITSGLGRLIFGKIADIPRVNRIFLQQISFILIGVLTMLLTVTNKFELLVVIALFMGLFDGCFISLLGPIAFEICGQKGATQAIGFLLGLCSIPLTVGPPIAGLIYDHTKSYTLPFLLAGIPPIVGALILFLVCCVPEEDTCKRQPSLCLVEAPLHDSAITPLQNDAGNSDEGMKLSTVANGVCSKSASPPPSYKEAMAEDGTVGDDPDSGNQQKSEEQQISGEEEIQEESESLLDAINKITLIKSH
ncbi:monocarboxylate transporter 10 isoform X2 [Zootermopsis nevadensis]|uniref:monocarboxylate transporter 10 isoform X2 n=1 Tax=Zootermopsis nevadensis TaxID=136037 RepID=UPI000B8ED5F6|nr:monocarboxylate transporter 10 isoform X2 [Zootermopsis nevadensis]